MGYVFLFLMGFGFAVMGGVTIIAYMNFLPAGLSWGEYFSFILSRIECYFLPIGIVMMSLVISRLPNKLK
ncbi:MULTISPECIES: hypothetical protein [Virgibacillus]|uniref:Uncharacterized protein n=2 Tax=Virgibacillus TaxID=84406 RepID=A0A024QFC0_9BACI|nr:MULTISPECIES: hypothetical protein [Virgibacillus]EQB35186.1 hypothetical protein M948_18985 [Virgibacillus sp. CM-4]MYL42758.1 hypothetical protein [Virgibacillus massiliensis]GGJ69228.1 hypothetical protein GCM10007111_33600 [Virgibacillus kapii]CDQ40651.1 hypothetical protein BN990_02978 [Virgibacillus massiliensis]